MTGLGTIGNRCSSLVHRVADRSSTVNCVRFFSWLSIKIFFSFKKPAKKWVALRGFICDRHRRDTGFFSGASLALIWGRVEGMSNCMTAVRSILEVLQSWLNSPSCWFIYLIVSFLIFSLCGIWFYSRFF